MRTLGTIVFVLIFTALALAETILAAEFYVIRSRSGVVAIRDHKPAGAATILKGPFNTIEDAAKVLQEIGAAQFQQRYVK